MKMLVGLLCLSMMLVGCKTTGGAGGGGITLSDSLPIIKSVTSLGAQIAFSQPDVVPHKDKICEVTNEVAETLRNYENPEATFETVRKVALDVIRNSDLSDNVRSITITIVDSVLNTGWAFVRTNYVDLVTKDQTRTVLAVSRAVAEGIEKACGFSPSAADIVILDK